MAVSKISKCCILKTIAISIIMSVLVGLHSKISFRRLDLTLSGLVINPPINGSQSLLFRSRPLVIWSNDYHIAPIKDLKYLLQPLGVSFIDKSLSGHCHVTNTCEGKSTLKVIDINNAMDLAGGVDIIRRFYDAYRDDAEMNTVDAFACFLPPAMCELFEPFNRSLIIVVPTRYEAARRDAARWTAWNANLLRYSQDSRNLIAANNLYDAEYVKYFTGIQPILLPSYCGYITEKYDPTRSGFLVAPIHHNGLGVEFFAQIGESCSEINCSVSIRALRDVYPSYSYSDIASHPGIIYVPYQVSVMSFFEQYRMNIPLFCPSLSLLTEWQKKHVAMTERTWDGVFGKRPSGSVISAHSTQRGVPDPNNEQDSEAIRYWIKFSDYYVFPHVTYYDSAADLVRKLENISRFDLMKISREMQVENKRAKKELIAKWTEIVRRIARHSRNRPH